MGAVSFFTLVHQLRFADSYRWELPPCFEVGAPFHHRFQPSCQGPMNTPQGPVSLFTNEDSLRDAPRAEILEKPNRVLLLGDSNVEGWWLSPAQTLGALLSAEFPETYFINGGLRSTGPLFQAQYFDRLLDTYEPRSVILLMNDTDTSDDKLACALAEDINLSPEAWKYSLDDFELGPWEGRLVGTLGNTEAGRRLKTHYYRERWAKFVASERGQRCETCLGLKEMNRLAKKRGVPLRVIYFKMREEKMASHYPLDASALERYLRCFEELKIPFFVLDNNRLSAEEVERYFWPNDFHRNPEGMAYFVAQITPALEDWQIVPENRDAPDLE